MNAIRFYLLSFWRYDWRRAVLLVFLSVVSSLLQGAGLLLILPFLQILGVIESDAALPRFIGRLVEIWRSSPIPFTLVSALTGYAVLVSFVAALRFTQTILQHGLVLGFTRQLLTGLYAKLTHAPWTRLASIPRAELFQNIQHDAYQIEACVREVMKGIGAMLIGGVYLWVAFQLSAELSVICLAAGGLIALALWPLRRRIERLAGAIRTARRDIVNRIDERLTMIKLVKSFGREDLETAEFDGLVAEQFQQSRRITLANALAPLTFAVLGAVFLSIYIWVGVSLLAVPPERVLILILVFSRLMPILTGLQSLRHQLAAARPSIEAFRAREIELESDREPIQRATSSDCLPLEREIRLAGVCFTYPGKTEPALADLDAVIPARSITALAGPSGSGKTTTADLVLGLLAPDAGTISVDGVALDERSILRWRGSTAYMPQEQLLMHDTIRANLIWAAPDSTDEQLWDALEQAAAAEFVRQLPEQLDSIVGDRGVKMSGGERQRISLARALLLSPTLLVLDEPTSALDDENEAAIQSALAEIRR